MPAFDNLLMFRSTGAFTQSESHDLTIRGTGYLGMAARVTAPITGTQTAFTARVLPRYYVSDDDVTYNLAFTYPGGAQNYVPSLGLDLITPIVTSAKYIREELVKFSTFTMGVVQSGLVTGVGFDWTRAVNFE
jgi:hypothetical protein